MPKLPYHSYTSYCIYRTPRIGGKKESHVGGEEKKERTEESEEEEEDDLGPSKAKETVPEATAAKTEEEEAREIIIMDEFDLGRMMQYNNSQLGQHNAGYGQEAHHQAAEDNRGHTDISTILDQIMNITDQSLDEAQVSIAARYKNVNLG